MSLVFFTACSEPEELFVREYRWVMDTQISVYVFYHDRDTAANERYHRAIASEAADMAYMFDRLFDRFTEGTDIWRINHAGGEYVEVDDHVIQALQYALYFRELTNGRFDPTIGAVMDLWDFGFYNEALLPSQADIDRALETVGTNIYIDGNRVRLGHPEARIDLGGIAKGYAADYVADFLRSRGVVGIANFQGDIALVGIRPSGNRWGVGVSDPLYPGPGFPPYVLSVHMYGETAVVTSGTTARGFITEGRRFHHIMDPETGWPIHSPWASITVITDNALWGEALTTAVYTMHENELMELFWQLQDRLDVFEFIGIDESGEILSTSGVSATFENMDDPDVIVPIFLN